MKTTAQISGYHAHIYFDADTLPETEKLALKADAELPVKVGRIHQGKTGPHPRWSCQLYFEADAANTVIPWLAHNRGDLTIFLHMLSGDDYLDHTQYTFWMGEILELNLDFLTP